MTKLQRKRIKSSGEESAKFTDLSLHVALVDLEFRASAKFTNLSSQITL
jgi:hypothetical protein